MSLEAASDTYGVVLDGRIEDELLTVNETATSRRRVGLATSPQL
nr:hypothetical protein [Rhodococcus qingshengii]